MFVENLSFTEKILQINSCLKCRFIWKKLFVTFWLIHHHWRKTLWNKNNLHWISAYISSYNTHVFFYFSWSFCISRLPPLFKQSVCRLCLFVYSWPPLSLFLYLHISLFYGPIVPVFNRNVIEDVRKYQSSLNTTFFTCIARICIVWSYGCCGSKLYTLSAKTEKYAHILRSYWDSK